MTVLTARKLITISLPPQLLRKAEEIAKEEHRTKSELLREALRFYVETKGIRRAAVRGRVIEALERAQARAMGTSPREIRKLIRESIEAVRRDKRRASA